MRACPDAFAIEVNPTLNVVVVIELIDGLGVASVTTAVVEIDNAELSVDVKYVTPSPMAFNVNL